MAALKKRETAPAAPAPSVVPATPAPSADKAPGKATAPHTVTVTRTHTVSGNVVSDENIVETLAVHSFATTPAVVTVGGKVTRNQGDFNSVQVFVSVAMPCYVEEVDATYSRVSAQVAGFIQTEVESVGGAAPTAGSNDFSTDEPASEVGADEGQPEVAEEAAEEEGEVTAEYIRSLDDEALAAFLVENPDLGVSADDYPTSELLADAIIEAAGLEDAEAPAEEAAAEEDGYTESELLAMSNKDLGEILRAWELTCTVPKGTKADGIKVIYVKTILDRQNGTA